MLAVSLKCLVCFLNDCASRLQAELETEQTIVLIGFISLIHCTASIHIDINAKISFWDSFNFYLKYLYDCYQFFLVEYLCNICVNLNKIITFITVYELNINLYLFLWQGVESTFASGNIYCWYWSFCTDC